MATKAWIDIYDADAIIAAGVRDEFFQKYTYHAFARVLNGKRVYTVYDDTDVYDEYDKDYLFNHYLIARWQLIGPSNSEFDKKLNSSDSNSD